MSVTPDQSPLPANALAALLSLQTRTHVHPLILCFATGATLPRFSVPMPRDPAPPLDVAFDLSFHEILDRARAANPSVHDGAVMLLRRRQADTYRLAGWSYRLAPPFLPDRVSANRGSAYNSALSMSVVPRVDAVALLGRDGYELFADGAGKQMTSTSKR